VIFTLNLCLAAGLAASTRFNYSHPQRQFLEFCRRYHLDPFKPSEELYCLFAVHEAMRNVAASTISQYLSAVQSFYVDLGIPPPDREQMRRMHRVLNGIKRLQASMRLSEGKPRMPITAGVLLKFRSHLHLDTERDATLWSIFTTAFFGLLRPSEFSVRLRNGEPISAPLLVGCARWDEQRQAIDICLMWDKTHQPGRSQPPPIICLYRIGGPLCPVEAMNAMLTLRARREGRPATLSEYLFVIDGIPLSYETLSVELHRLSTAIGLSGMLFSGHSFRIGAATSAIGAGIPEVILQHLGRWKSDAFKRYVLLAEEQHPVLRAAQIRMASFNTF
jgi:hypothetical protein